MDMLSGMIFLKKPLGKGVHMKSWRLLVIPLLIAAITIATVGGAYAAPLLQGEKRVGLFGTVSAVVDGTIILDGGEIVATDENTQFLVPGVDGATIEEVTVGDRLAIVVLEAEDGSLLALDVLSTPAEPVNNDHIVGVVTGAEGGLITITDNRGNEFTVELPETAVVAVGDFLTVVSTPGKGAEKRSAKATATITMS